MQIPRPTGRVYDPSGPGNLHFGSTLLSCSQIWDPWLWCPLCWRKEPFKVTGRETGEYLRLLALVLSYAVVRPVTSLGLIGGVGEVGQQPGAPPRFSWQPDVCSSASCWADPALFSPGGVFVPSTDGRHCAPCVRQSSTRKVVGAAGLAMNRGETRMESVSGRTASSSHLSPAEGLGRCELELLHLPKTILMFALPSF